MRQYKLMTGPFPPESVFTGEMGRLKSYERQKPSVENKTLLLILFPFSLIQRFSSPFDQRNPYLAPVTAIRELFQKDCQRSCLHLELDISNSRLKFVIYNLL